MPGAAEYAFLIPGSVSHAGHAGMSLFVRHESTNFLHFLYSREHGAKYKFLHFLYSRKVYLENMAGTWWILLIVIRSVLPNYRCISQRV